MNDINDLKEQLAEEKRKLDFELWQPVIKMSEVWYRQANILFIKTRIAFNESGVIDRALEVKRNRLSDLSFDMRVKEL